MFRGYRTVCQLVSDSVTNIFLRTIVILFLVINILICHFSIPTFSSVTCLAVYKDHPQSMARKIMVLYVL